MTERGRSILIVDDSEDSAELFSLFLHAEGYLVHSVFDGSAGLEAVARRAFDLMILDLLMPEMDGFEVLERLRAGADRSEMPILVVTSLDSTGEAVRALRMGANDFITKPVDPPILMARVHSQLARERALRELRAANDDLEAFSYSVSHELRAPVRALNGYCLALAEDCGHTLDEAATGYLQRISAAAVRMERAIDGLLKLSHISRYPLRRVDVDISALAASILEDLRAAEPDRQLEARIEPGLVAGADRELTRMVLENLLGNAWKYTSKTQGARIEVGTLPGDRAMTLFVRDNGVGFDMAHADRLFQPFQRLVSGEEFEGSGIGLATAARVIRRHGGRIWAASARGRGTTIYFTWTGAAAA